MIEMMRGMMAPPGAPTMQAFRERLSDDEIDAVLAYIRTMWTPQQRESQAQATRQQC
ncbi:MAG: c-type cytochrome [Chloroflexi bacterium]|nr:c-type cytochrome [Chloroflexota bacterium]